MTNYIEHKPVMAKQVAELLVSNEEGIYVDATAGSGGHLGLLAEYLSRGILYRYRH